MAQETFSAAKSSSVSANSRRLLSFCTCFRCFDALFDLPRRDRARYDKRMARLG